jgi:hypothetical protein
VHVFKTKWFERFARKNKVSNDVLWEAIERAEKGIIDADLGGGVIKQRIARAGQGRSRGYRTIIIFCKGKRSFFVYGLAKNEKENISRDEEVQFRNMAEHLLSLSEEHLGLLLETGDFVEVKNHDSEH